MKRLLQILGVKGDFGRLFFINEYKALVGDKKGVVLKLIAILFLTLFALGFAVGSIENLNSKMNNPYTNWVNLKVTQSVANKVEDIQLDFASSDKKEQFKLNDVRGSVRFVVEMYHQNYNPTRHDSDSLCYATWGFTIDGDDPLLDKILVEENNAWKYAGTIDTTDAVLENCEMIVTREMMSRLGYETGNVDLGNIFLRLDGFPLPMKVVAIVNELPKFCDFVCSAKVYNILTTKKDQSVYCNDLLIRNSDGRNSFNFLVEENCDIDKLAKLIESYFELSEQPTIRISEDIVSGQKIWKVCEVYFGLNETPILSKIGDFTNYAGNNNQPISQLVRMDCSGGSCSAIENYYQFAFNFERLDNIRDFKIYMKEEHEVDIDMTQVESKENFAIVAQLTSFIAIILLAFGILSIILFVNSLLQSHLFKVRSNLGTFKAFGLSNTFLNKTYLKIILAFLLISILIAFGLTVIVDRVEFLMFAEESKFNVFSIKVLLALVALVCISLFISSRTIKRILGDTPGNLIYER